MQGVHFGTIPFNNLQVDIGATCYKNSYRFRRTIGHGQMKGRQPVGLAGVMGMRAV